MCLLCVLRNKLGGKLPRGTANDQPGVFLQQTPAARRKKSHHRGCERWIFTLSQLHLYLILEEAEQYLGMSMTYSLFEWVRESLDTLLTSQPETLQTVCEDLESKLSVDTNQDDGGDGGGKSKVKKEQLSKAQKRSLWKKGGVNEDDRERGWNWVDIVRHLSQGGGAN